MRTGFSLLELMIVISIIGVMMSIITPGLFKQKAPIMDTFLIQINALTQLGSQAAIKSGEIKKILFDIAGKKINLENIAGAVEKSLTIPMEIEVTDFFVNGKSVFSLGATKLTGYFLINPDGITQDTSINLEDTSINKVYNLTLNPFTKQFS